MYIEAAKWVFNELRERKIFEAEEAKLVCLEAFYEASRGLAFDKPTEHCLIHSGKRIIFGSTQAWKYLCFLLFKAIMPKNKHKEKEPQTMSSPTSF
jgi:hypothetical protein